MNYDVDFFQTFEQTGGRRVLFVAQTGSLNYNLETPTSDKDFQVFLLPNFEDLYHRRLMSSEYTSPELDVKFHDVRHLGHQLMKSNPNFLDMLFSKNLVYVHPQLQFLVDEREQLAKSDLSRLFYSSKGLVTETLRRVLKTDEPLFYDGKQHSHAERVVRLLFDYRVNLPFNALGNAYEKSLRGSTRHVLRMKQNLVHVDKELVPYDSLTDAQKEKHMEWVRLDVEDLPKKLMTLEQAYTTPERETAYLEEVESRLRNRVKFLLLEH